MTWLKIGRKCWHRPTKRPVEVVSLCKDGKVRIRPRDGKEMFIQFVPASDLQIQAPRLNHPRTEYSESELAAADAWGLKPWQVRRIRGGKT